MIKHEPESRLVYSTDPLQRPPVVRTSYVIHSIATAAHLGALGYEVTTTETGRWRAPIETQHIARRYEATFLALRRAGDKRKREQRESAS